MRNAMNIYKRKDGRFEGRIPIGYSNNGKIKYRYLYSKNLTELKEKMMCAYINSDNPMQGSADKTLKELCSEWLLSAKLRVKQSSYCCYEKLINKHILPYFEDIMYSELNTPIINSFAEHKLKYGKINGFGGISAKSVHDILIVMRSVAKYAEQEYGYRNPMRNISIPKSENKKTKVFSKDERSRLQNHLRRNPTESNLGILLAMYSGLRIGELCALTWDDIDFDNGIVHISKALQRVAKNSGDVKTTIAITSPKSKTSVRDIPVPLFVLNSMKQKKRFDGSYILSGTSKPVEPRTMQNRFKAVLKGCGIRNANFHLLRHTYATVCIENGFDAKTVSELLGHSNVNITLNRYVHSSMEMKRMCVERLNFAL
ncbi:MAG: site-specific integrase [Firmicutes bacterium]|nr:site-specific integrase [[Eubacterium] siraeum]MCM1487904.1 site-specific integrase [Bacillota bacterium]